MAATFLALALVGGVVIRLFDEEDFPTIGVAIWWALQTVTTVGYGDVVPETAVGRVIGSLVMVIGVSFIAFLTAGVTSTVIQRSGESARHAERERDANNTQAIIDALSQTREAITQLDRRLDRIESSMKT